jgi:hypothetical protein
MLAAELAKRRRRKDHFEVKRGISDRELESHKAASIEALHANEAREFAAPTHLRLSRNLRLTPPI